MSAHKTPTTERLIGSRKMRYCAAFVAHTLTYSRPADPEELRAQAAALCWRHFGWDISPLLFAGELLVIGSHGLLTTCHQEERDVHALIGDALEPDELHAVTEKFTPRDLVRVRRRRYRHWRPRWSVSQVHNLWRISSIQSLVNIQPCEKPNRKNTGRGPAAVAAGLPPLSRYIA